MYWIGIYKSSIYQIYITYILSNIYYYILYLYILHRYYFYVLHYYILCNLHIYYSLNILILFIQSFLFLSLHPLCHPYYSWSLEPWTIRNKTLSVFLMNYNSAEEKSTQLCIMDSYLTYLEQRCPVGCLICHLNLAGQLLLSSYLSLNITFCWWAYFKDV